MKLPPHSTDAEQAVIGACLTYDRLVPDFTALLAPGDFYTPILAAVWASLDSHYRAGHVANATAVALELDSQWPGIRATLADCTMAFASEESARTLAAKIADLAALRRVQHIATQALETITVTSDPLALIDGITDQLAQVDLAADTRPVEGLWTMADMLDADFPRPPEIIPGFLREMDRLLLVGVEGSGKSVMTRQIAAMAAAGRHPFTGARTAPQPTLVIDVENPEHVIVDGLRLMPTPTDTWAPVHILARPGGINIRRRADRSLIHKVCEQVQPKLVTIGPLYKMHRPENGENDEDAAVRVQHVIDDLRTRFRCAVIIEHHAPKGSDSFRKLVPFGSSAWMRWPEFGWTLVPHSPDKSDGSMGRDSENGQSLRLGTFRGDRVAIDKPDRFDRGKPWPWVPYWANGIPRAEPAEQF